MLTAYAKLSIRFGEDSEVTRMYGAFNEAIDKYMAPLNEFRKSMPLTPELESDLKKASDAAASARDAFIRAASRAMRQGMKS